MDMIIRTQPNSSSATAEWNGRKMACVVGRRGPMLAEDKREGDGATPLGGWKVLYGMYRADRVTKPRGGLVWRAITPEDGWCDAPDDPLYNQPVPVGYPASHEVLWRADTAYDYLVVLDHNQPVKPRMGSAVFMHVGHPGKTHTAGCVALAVEDLQQVLATLGVGDRVVIQQV